MYFTYFIYYNFEIICLLSRGPRRRRRDWEQVKRVTVGVEMAANPAVLFLDEPTSGLVGGSAGDHPNGRWPLAPQKNSESLV